MIRIIFAITLSILIFAGCAGNVTPDPALEKKGADTTSPAEVNVKNEEKPKVEPPQQEEQQLMSEAEIKKIALEWVEGATEDDIREFEKERDDGKWKYDVTIVYNKTEYELEIDAVSGEVLTWDKESIYD